jgi:murein DD-endopeptidase MepM/ murein hydrolase activator NlpD
MLTLGRTWRPAASAVACSLLTAAICFADDPCEDASKAVAAFVASLPTGGDYCNGEFRLQDIKGSSRALVNGQILDMSGTTVGLAVSFGRGGQSIFRRLLRNPGGDWTEHLEGKVIRSGKCSGVYLRFLYGATGRMQCAYVIVPVANGFQSRAVPAAQSRVEDLDGDGQTEIIGLGEDPAPACAGSMAVMSWRQWRSIYHIDSQTGQLVDASSQFPKFYAALAEDYRAVLKEPPPGASPECAPQLQAAIRRAESLSGVAGSNAGRAPSGMFYPAGSRETGGYLGWLGRNPDFGDPPPYHLGVDFKRTYGDPVYAVTDGEVVMVRTDVGSYGGVGVRGGGMIVRYRGSNGRTFYGLYAHVENMKSPGPVRAGEVIGSVGNYRRKTGNIPHLHFGLFLGERLPSGGGWPWRQYVQDLQQNQGWVDPLRFLETEEP